MRSSKQKHRIEFFKSFYGQTCLFLESDRIQLNGKYTEILMQVSKGFENRIADGDNIYFLTDNQLNKLLIILQHNDN